MFVGLCRGCGTRRKRPWWVMVILALLIGFAGFVALGVLGLALGPKKERQGEVEPPAAKPTQPDVVAGPAASNSPTPVPAPVAPVAPEVVEVSAKQLHADYKENEVSADSKYRGKILRVSGKITQIGKDILDNPFVELATSNEFEGVHAGFANERALGSLKRGQKIAVRCRGKGMTIGSPMLDGCTIE